MSDFPLTVSASSRANFVRCPHLFYRDKIQRLRLNRPEVHRTFGAAMADGLHAARLAVFRDRQSIDVALARAALVAIRTWGNLPIYPDGPGSIPNKSLESLLACLAIYIERDFPLDREYLQPVNMPDGSLAVECSFVVPTNVRHPQPERAEFVCYSGRLDAIVHRDGTFYGLDDKTTGSLRGDWAAKWRLRGQFVGYRWAARQLGLKLSGIIVRGVNPLKTEVKTIETTIVEPPWRLDRFQWQLERDIDRMIRHWQEGVWDYALDEACTQFNGCDFLPVCESLDPAPFLTTEYVVRESQPLPDPK